MQFITHTKEIIKGKRLTDALNKVADKMVENANLIRVSKYADHVTEEQKEVLLQRDLEYAEKVRNGFFENMSIWQTINTELTGECIGILK